MRVTNILRQQAQKLRILFCGSDSFGAVSLARLRTEMEANPALISSIDVFCRKEKPSGRGMKSQREIPTAKFAQENNLPLYQVETFRGWELPSPIDLIVAVSFGLFVPPRILGAAKYGGINVHPSLLPKYRGAAPIHHAVLNKDPYTGVTVQTLDPKAFDHGKILARTENVLIDYFSISNFSWTEPRAESGDSSITPFENMKTLLAIKGADLLLDTIKKGLFVPPINDLATSLPNEEEASEAPKITKENARLVFPSTTPEQAVVRSWVTGHLFCQLAPKPNESLSRAVSKRVLFYGVEKIAKPENVADDYLWENAQPGTSVTLGYLYVQLTCGREKLGGMNRKERVRLEATSADSERAAIKVKDGWISVRRAKVEGSAETSAREWVKNYSAALYELL